MRHLRIVAAISIVCALCASNSAAQTSIQIPLQFDFVNPGAKSLALGGAFAGIADDATAGVANPAGLRELGRPELSIEVRGRRLETSYLQRGRLSGALTNEGTDVIAGPVFGKSPDHGIGVPYISVVWPKPQQGWVIGAFRHELARIDQSSFSEGVFQQDPAEFTSRREFPQQGLRKITLTNYGATGAIEINRRLAVGGTMSLYKFSLLSEYRRFGYVGFLGPPNLNAPQGVSTQEGDDFAFAPTVGLRLCLKACDERQTASTRFGVVYRHGPSFDFDTQSGPNHRTSRFRVPHVLTGGVAVELPQSGRRLLLLADIRRVTYSRLREDFITDQAMEPTDIRDSIRVNDGTELRAGVQYTLETQAWLPRFRAGIWSDPDHSVHWVEGAPADHPQTRTLQEVMGVALSTGKRRTHFSGGIGLTFSPTVEWNFGADFASSTTNISTSVIVKLGR